MMKLKSFILQLCVCVLLLQAGPASAHLMVAQKGTLNFVGSGAFMVLSVPVSAFENVDDDSDNVLSLDEFRLHQADMKEQVLSSVQLFDDQEARPLQGLMLSPSLNDDDPLAPISQLIVMGRFALPEEERPLRFEMQLFGTAESEQTQHMTMTRKANDQVQLLQLTPSQPSGTLFPSAWSTFVSFVEIGAEHIVLGLDHLLFLLVVLATGWRFRTVLMVLSVFTVGHAATLMFSVWGGVSVSPALVEPAIAATIVIMSLFDLYSRRYNVSMSSFTRLALVFFCALIHGLGLASALNELGLVGQHQLTALLGFNVGVELGQVAVALLAFALVFGIQRVRGSFDIVVLTQRLTFVAMALGGVWFVQRVAGLV